MKVLSIPLPHSFSYLYNKLSNYRQASGLWGSLNIDKKSLWAWSQQCHHSDFASERGSLKNWRSTAYIWSTLFPPKESWEQEVLKGTGHCSSLGINYSSPLYTYPRCSLDAQLNLPSSQWNWWLQPRVSSQWCHSGNRTAFPQRLIWHLL